jgi:hypothetical protein
VLESADDGTAFAKDYPEQVAGAVPLFAIRALACAMLWNDAWALELPERFLSRTEQRT